MIVESPAFGARPLRVLHVLDSMGAGGLENVVATVSRSLEGRAFQFHAACLRRRGEFAERMPRPDRVIVLGKTTGFSLRATLRLAALIRHVDADILHTHNLSPLVYATLANLASGRRVMVHTEHGQIQAHDLVRRRVWMRRTLYRRCHTVSAVSEGVRSHLEQLKLLSGPACVLPTGVDSERFTPSLNRGEAKRKCGLNPEDTVVGIVGRFIPSKRHEVLVDACARLAGAFPLLRLLVIGDHHIEDNAIVKMMRNHSFADRIVWLGHREDMPDCYAAMDLLAAPSRIEGLSNVLLESMACGVPAITHTACGNDEIISDGVSGWLRTLDDADQTAVALADILSSPSQISVAGARAREFVCAHFSLQTMAAGYAGLYSRAMGGTQTG